MHLAYIKGDFVPTAEARLPLTDLSITRGLAVFDYTRTYGRKPFHLRKHIDRLRASAETFQLTLTHSLEEIEYITEKIIASYLDKELGITYLLSGGLPKGYLLPGDSPTFAVHAAPVRTFPKEHYRDGIAVATTPHQRPFPTAKHTCYTPGIVALQQHRHAEEALHLSPENHILEGVTTNFFAIKDGTLYTAPEPLVLPGITRKLILDIAKEIMPVKMQAIHKDDTFSEAFITSSNREVMPISKIDDMGLSVGPLTQEIMKRFSSKTQK